MHQKNEQDALEALLGAVRHDWLARQLRNPRGAEMHPGTLGRWARGDKVPADAYARVVEAIRRLLPEHEEEAPPRWAVELHAETLKGLRATQGDDVELLDQMIAAAEAQAEQLDAGPEDHPPGGPGAPSSSAQ